MTLIVSIDVGILHLAVCVFEIHAHLETRTLLLWELVDLTRMPNADHALHKLDLMCTECANPSFDDHTNSQQPRRKRPRSTTTPSKLRKVHYVCPDGTKHYCKLHAKLDPHFQVPPSKEYTVAYIQKPSTRIVELRRLGEAWGINEDGGKRTKTQWVQTLSQHLQRTYLQLHVPSRASELTNDITLAKHLTAHLEELQFRWTRFVDLSTQIAPVTHIVIENQLGKFAAKMSKIQGMIVQYFTMINQGGSKDAYEFRSTASRYPYAAQYIVHIVSAQNKLRDLVHKSERESYPSRKIASVRICESMLSIHCLDWVDYFQKYKARGAADDLADAWTQGWWFLTHKIQSFA
jgi:hypothetical protein